MKIDLELIQKYDRPGPRYTSYPTAPQFSSEFTHEDFLNEIIRTNRGENFPDLSLYFHLPFCDSLCYFCGCNMIVTHNRDRIRHYLNYLKKEIDRIQGLIAEGRKVVQLHWGGGTPTHLAPEEITDLIDYIRQRFDILPEAEVSCEIDPRELSREHLEALSSGGFNRISMGVQDFHAKVQKAVNRIQPEPLTRRVIGWVRELGFESVNIDLIYGLPFQTAGNFEKTIDTIIDMSPDRIALFNFAYVPWMKKHQKRICAEDLPEPGEKLRILKMAVEKLIGAGYIFIGMDHFAKPGDELATALAEKKLYRNFQGYSTRVGTDLYAMGITSISQFGRVYAQNVKTEKEYFRALDEGILATAKGYRLTPDDILRREVISRLMCDFELDFKVIEERFGIDFKSYFRWGLDNLNEMLADQLITIQNDRLQVTDMGRMLIRNIAMNFDGYLERKQDQGRYSRTV